MIEIRPPGKKDSPREYLRFFNKLIEEDTFLMTDEKQTLEKERRWLSDALKDMRNGKRVMLSAFEGKRVVGNCDAKKDRGKGRRNILFGVAIEKEYRGRGLGEKLLRSTIKLAKERLEPRNMYLCVFGGNSTAMELYKKVGFEEIARLPNWVKHRGRYVDEIYMILR
jgi:putative acetyltransferase